MHSLIHQQLRPCGRRRAPRTAPTRARDPRARAPGAGGVSPPLQGPRPRLIRRGRALPSRRCRRSASSSANPSSPRTAPRSASWPACPTRQRRQPVAGRGHGPARRRDRRALPPHLRGDLPVRVGDGDDAAGRRRGARARRRLRGDRARRGAQAAATRVPSRSCCSAAARPPTPTRTPSSPGAERRVRRLLCAALAAAAAAAPARRGERRRAAAIGIGEQSPAIFQDPSWQQLGSRDVRYIVAWDALRVPWQKRRGRRLPGGRARRRRARAARLQPLALAAASRAASTLPSPTPLPARVPAPSARTTRGSRVPDLERGQPPRPADLEPPGHRRPLLRHAAPQLPQLHDRRPVGARHDSRCRAGCRQVEKAAKHRVAHLGAAQLHRRQPLPHARHALAAAARARRRRRSGSRRPAGSCAATTARRIEFADSKQHAVKATRQVREARPPEPARPARLLLPLGRARARTPPGTPR